MCHTPVCVCVCGSGAVMGVVGFANQILTHTLSNTHHGWTPGRHIHTNGIPALSGVTHTHTCCAQKGGARHLAMRRALQKCNDHVNQVRTAVAEDDAPALFRAQLALQNCRTDTAAQFVDFRATIACIQSSMPRKPMWSLGDWRVKWNQPPP